MTFGPDLALAKSAAAGDANAVRTLTAQLEGPLRRAIMRAGYAAAIAEDATQETLIHLLVDGGLASYQGRAPLAMWAKTIGLRLAARMHAAMQKVEQAATSDEFAPDAVMRSLRHELSEAVVRAFRAAAAKLSMFDRELLRAAFIDGEQIDALARRHDVHRATAARWVGRARGALDAALRDELGTDLALGESEVSSVLRNVATSLVLPIEPLAE